MKSIPTEVYSNLSTPERIRVTIAAIGRGDGAEIETLFSTCPRKRYEGLDHEFSDGMERLRTLGLAVTCDLQSEALNFLVASRLEAPEAVHDALVLIASVEGAWHALLAEMGIDREEMTRASPARHHAVDVILSLASGEEIPESVEVHLQAMRAFLNAC